MRTPFVPFSWDLEDEPQQSLRQVQVINLSHPSCWRIDFDVGWMSLFLPSPTLDACVRMPSYISCGEISTSLIISGCQDLSHSVISWKLSDLVEGRRHNCECIHRRSPEDNIVRRRRYIHNGTNNIQDLLS